MTEGRPASELEVVPLESVGIQIVGLDLGRLNDPALREELYTLWLEHGIILFRGTGATREQHLELSRVFGPLEVHPIPKVRVPGQEELVEIKESGGYYMIDGQLVGGFIPWHQDTCYTPDICKGAILFMDTPAEVGGQTGWIDTAKAYDALPKALREQAEGKDVVMYVHNAKPDGMRFVQHERSFRRPTAEEWAGENLSMPDFPPVVHPLVVTHPESGRKSLSISPSNVDAIFGMPREESEALLRALVEHVLKPEFRYVHQWQKGDMVLWDNRRTLHQAFGWPVGMPRKAFRTTLEGGVKSGRFLEAHERQF
ncbi:TauD/TfdA dioxygenase family protein [Rhizorhabdus argentea]|uniref:TauD/TfdA dioxygenase family protein n=1 Tax=Rhizorhabdus argentea TaxID=1387174 RepID=UPI0030EEA421